MTLPMRGSRTESDLKLLNKLYKASKDDNAWCCQCIHLLKVKASKSWSGWRHLQLHSSPIFTVSLTDFHWEFHLNFHAFSLIFTWFLTHFHELSRIITNFHPHFHCHDDFPGDFHAHLHDHDEFPDESWWISQWILAFFLIFLIFGRYGLRYPFDRCPTSIW